MTPVPVLANTGAMSQFIGAFEVTSKLSGQTYQCRFSHLWNAVATRHADTIDTKFFVDGHAHVVGLGAEFLRERLEEEDLRPLYDVPASEVTRLIQKIGIR